VTSLVPSPRSLVATPYRRGVLVLALVTLCWRVWTVSRWTWHNDDWEFVEGSTSMPLWDYLFQDHHGHVMPGGLLVTKLITAASPLDFSLVVVLVAAASLLNVLLWGLAFERVTRGSTVALMPLAVLALSPVLVEPMMWWACSVNALPMQLSLALMVIVACRWTDGRNRRDLAWLGIAFLTGLAFWHKSLLLVLPAIVTVIALTPGNVRARLRAAVAPSAVLLVIAVPYLALFRYLTQRTQNSYDLELTLTGHSWGDSLTQYSHGFRDMFLPALLGGPWGSMQVSSDPLSTPSPWVFWAVAVVCVLGVGWLALRFPQVLWLLLLPFVYTVVTLGIILFSSRAEDVWDVMTIERYYVDAIMVAALAAALMIRGAQRQGSRAAPGPRWVLPVACAVLGTSLVAANVVAAERIGIHPGRAWVSALRSDITHLASQHSADSPVVLWDAYSPDDVLQAGFWPGAARLSEMLRPFGDAIAFQVPADRLYVVAESGHVVPLDVTPLSKAEPGPVQDCGYYVEPGDDVDIPMTNELFVWGWALELDGFSADGSEVVVDLGDHDEPVAIPAGLQSKVVQIEGGIGSELNVSVPADADGSVCITDIRVGSVQAAD
jgi:hypothetical protein